MKSTRRGSFSVHRSEKTPGSKYSATSGLSPRGHLERQAEFQTRPDSPVPSLQGPCRLGTGESGLVWNSACLSRCPRGERPLVALYLEPGVFSERCTERLPLRVDFIHRVEFGEVSGHRVLIKRGPGNRGPTECGTTHEAT